jgi:pre-mRNA-processing factor 39
MHQYARYFERYRAIAASRPVVELVPEDVLAQFKEALSVESGTKQKSDKEAEQELRSKIDSYHLEIFQRTQNETTKRWTYESEVKRPYYHVTELDEPQLVNWKKYLDFEEREGDYIRTKFLYERCLVTAANYEDMWLRYARWMAAQENRQEEVRNIYTRASCVYVPISRPTVRLFYAQFEESVERPDVAIAIHEAILLTIPNYVEAIVSLVNVYRRQHGLQKAIGVIRQYMDSPDSTVHTCGALVSEWARLIWRGTGDADAARQVYQKNEQLYLDSRAFWVNWLDFELQQPTSEMDEEARHQRIRNVFNDIRQHSRLPPDLVKELSATYFAYLKERGGKDAMKEYMPLDQEINGPSSTLAAVPVIAVEEGKRGKKRKKLNGGTSMDLDKTVPLQATNASSRGNAQQDGQPVNGG